jgi:FG-GAP-like repeat
VVYSDTHGGYVTPGASGQNTGLLGAGFGSSLVPNGASMVSGDFNGDHLTGLAVTFRGTPNAQILVGFATGTGAFNTVAGNFGPFADWLNVSGARIVPGDFNGDGRTDLALVGGRGWFTIPVAFSNGDGTFRVTNNDVPNFALWSRDPAARAFAEDLNGDGRTDIALTGGQTWFTVPTADSNGDGTFTVTNPPAGVFPSDTMPGGNNGSPIIQ